jgi:hypothetical protein
MDVIQTCKKENIDFVCLPANSTDNTQPLDVAYFGPLKGAWRKQLTAYSDQDPSAKAMDKTKFPGMLKEVMESMDAKRLLQSGFKKCGIYPLNRHEVLDRIPSAAAEDLQGHWCCSAQEAGGQKVWWWQEEAQGEKIPAGQSYSAEDSENEESEEEKVSDGDGLTSDEELQDLNSEHEDQEELRTEKLPDLDPPQPKRQAGSWVVALYEGDWFLCVVMADQEGVASGYTKLSYMAIKGKNVFSWGDKKFVFPLYLVLYVQFMWFFFVPAHLGHENIL